MRIGIDARELSGKPTGVGRYLAGLLREWTRPGTHRHEIVLYSHRAVEESAGCDVHAVAGTGGTLWEQRALPRAIADDGVDVLFSPAYSTPLATRVPRVVALHDISFVARPEWFGWREGLRRRVLARRSAAISRKVVTISEFSKREIIARLGVAASKIAVIPPGIDSPLAQGGSEAALHRHAQQGTHLLYVGSIFNRRHIPDLIAAFTRVGERHPDVWLHIVGDNRSHPFEDVSACISSSRVSARIEWHQYAPDQAVRQLYRQARGFVFLSEYEGLGLTPLEALSAGIPSLLLDTPVARESCGAAALYVPLGRVDAIATAIETLLYDEAARRSLAAAAPAALARYNWTTAARETMALLEAAG